MAESFTEMAERTGIPYAQLLRDNVQFKSVSTVTAETRESNAQVMREWNQNVIDNAKPGDEIVAGTQIKSSSGRASAVSKAQRVRAADPESSRRYSEMSSATLAQLAAEGAST